MKQLQNPTYPPITIRRAGLSESLETFAARAARPPAAARGEWRRQGLERLHGGEPVNVFLDLRGPRISPEAFPTSNGLCIFEES